MGTEGLKPLAGGFSGETFLAESAGTRTVVRVYSRRGAGRRKAAVAIDAAVLRLVRGLLPVHEVPEVHPTDPATRAPAVLVTSLLPGERLDACWPDLGPIWGICCALTAFQSSAEQSSTATWSSRATSMVWPERGRTRLVDLVRAADLVELAGRRGDSPVADRADAQLRAVAASRDLHAQAGPPQSHR